MITVAALAMLVYRLFAIISDAWAFISTKEIEHQAGEYKFMFEYQKSMGVILQV